MHKKVLCANRYFTIIEIMCFKGLNLVHQVAVSQDKKLLPQMISLETRYLFYRYISCNCEIFQSIHNVWFDTILHINFEDFEK